MTHDKKHALILQALPGIGAVALSKLYQQFGSFTKALQAQTQSLPPAYRKGLSAYHQQTAHFESLAQAVLDECLENDIDILLISSPDYPKLLREIDTAPTILFVKGDKARLNLPQIAIVGSRQHSVAGQQNARAFAQHLSNQGFTITSGLALGIDGAAHHGALETGNTIAVLGTGVNVIYPRRHQTLYGDILAKGGTLVSEYPPNTPARPGNFPQRNRIISGLSLGVLVVEAALRSGSLITARLAMEQNREVFAIPGSIHNPSAKGCHHLIRQGATLVETADDIIEEIGGLLAYKTEESNAIELNPTKSNSNTLEKTDQGVNNQGANDQGVNDQENAILHALGFDPTDLDTLIQRTQLPAATLSGLLINLELKGCVEQSAGIYKRLR